MDVKEISDLAEQGIASIGNIRLGDKIRELLVAPYVVEHPWDYGGPEDQFPCWTVLEHPPSNAGIAFCS